MKRAGFILIFLTVLNFSEAQNPIFKKNIAEQLNNMSLDEKLGQLFLVSAYAGGNEAHFEQLLKQISSLHLGGIVIENGNDLEIKDLISRLNGVSQLPLTAMADLKLFQENLPPSNALQSLKNKQLISELGISLAQKLKNTGVNLVTSDLFSSQHSKLESVGQHLGTGLMAVDILPVYLDPYGNLAELPGAVMVNGRDPLPLKKKMDYQSVPAFIKRKNGFNQLIVAQGQYGSSALSESEKIIYQLVSGVDLIITPQISASLLNDIKKAIKSKDLLPQLIDEKVRRILEFKQSQTLQPSWAISESANQNIYKKISIQSISLNRNENDMIPFKMLDTLRNGLISTIGPVENLSSLLNKFHKNSIISFNKQEGINQYNHLIVVADEETSQEDWQKIKAVNQTHSISLIYFGDTDLIGFQEFEQVITAPLNTPESQRALAQMLYGVLPFNGQNATAAIPLGMSRSIETTLLNRLSYASPEEAQMDQNTINKIKEIADEAISEGATPGLQIVVARHGKVIYEEAFGHYTYEKNEPVKKETIYDLASVTKVASTLQTVSFMHEKNLIDINQKISRYLPELKGTNKEHLIIKDILLHQAGLKPWLPFWQQTMSDEVPNPDLYNEFQGEKYPMQVSIGLYANPAIKDSVWHWIIDSKLMRKKGPKFDYRYSDMGFYIMHQLAERILNQPIDEFMNQNFYDPMGMTTTGYLPLKENKIQDIAPTAQDPYFRKQLIKGLVHDEGAAMFGGVAGHSGLFSNGNDLIKLGQMYLQNGNYGGEKYLSEETIKLFTTRTEKENRRGLGWDKPGKENERTPTSRWVSLDTYGHTGFTGTAIWIDPEFDLVYVFLSNRIHPDPENGKLISLNILSSLIIAHRINVGSTRCDFS